MICPAECRSGPRAACPNVARTWRWYGRGTADNKGQHSINLATLDQVLQARGGRLGFNLTILIETSKETGSPGLREFCARHRDDLAADLLIASQPTASRPLASAGPPTKTIVSGSGWGAGGRVVCCSLHPALAA
jgi:acetylornithine deacetylase/succinyl-diaminopimelate desuccinylase-like protein